MTKIDRAHNDAVVLLKSIAFPEPGVCSCKRCIQERLDANEAKLIRTIYPKLKFIPKVGKSYTKSTGIYGWYNYLETLRKTRLTNQKIRKQYPNQRVYYCRFCGKISPELLKVNEYIVCQSCHHDYILCDHCDDVTNKGSVAVVKTGKKVEHWCFRCVKQDKTLMYCTTCKLYMTNTSGFHSYFGNRHGPRDDQVAQYHLCADCDAKAKKHKCGCGEVVIKQTAYFLNSGGVLCPYCHEEHQGQHDHWYRPLRFHFHSLREEGKIGERELFMGFELEVANYENFIDHKAMSHIVKELMGPSKVYCVHDGTIKTATGYDGTEIVSHPFTWECYKDDIPEWDDLLLFLRRKGWKANLRGIGFHIHTNKKAWGSFQIYKLLEFVYTNQVFMSKIAQRQPNEYCRMDNEDIGKFTKIAKDKKNRSRHHYNAINLNEGNGNSSRTVEFRMFQGSLEPLYFHKNIEFVHSIYTYTRDYRDMTARGYIQFLEKNRRTYPCLSEFINLKRKEINKCV